MRSDGEPWWSRYRGPLVRVLFVVVAYGALAIRRQNPLHVLRVPHLFLFALVALAVLLAEPLVDVGVRLGRREGRPVDYLVVALFGVVALLIAAAVKSAYL